MKITSHMPKNFKVQLVLILLFSATNNANAAHLDKLADNGFNNSTQNVAQDTIQDTIKDAQPSKSNVSSQPHFDFINADSPFKYVFNHGEQQASIQLYGVIDIARAKSNHSLPANYELPNNLYPYSGAKKIQR